MPSRTSSPIFSATSTSARWSRVHADQQLEPLLDVRGLEQLALLLVGEVRRVAGRVGDRARVGHPLDGVDDLPGLAALQHGDDQPLVLLGELAGVVGRRSPRPARPRPTARRRGRCTPLPMRARRPARSTAAGAAAAQPADLLDGRHHAVRRVAVLEPGREQQLAVAAGAGGVDRGLGGLVERDRHDHAGQHHDVGEEQHRERGLSHTGSTSAGGPVFRRSLWANSRVEPAGQPAAVGVLLGCSGRPMRKPWPRWTPSWRSRSS